LTHELNDLAQVALRNIQPRKQSTHKRSAAELSPQYCRSVSTLVCGRERVSEKALGESLLRIVDRLARLY
jgi:hypothetical protein